MVNSVLEMMSFAFKVLDFDTVVRHLTHHGSTAGQVFEIVPGILC